MNKSPEEKKHHLQFIQEWPLYKTSRELQVALSASFTAGNMLREAFYSDFESSVRADKSEFTPFDEQAEILARNIIANFDPDATILSEELSPDTDVTEKNFWVIDGIDGTTNFSRNIPLCNFTMAYVENGKTKLGTVYDFLHDQMYYAVRDQGAFVNGQPIETSPRSFGESVISFAPLLDVRKDKGEQETEMVAAIWNGMKEIVEQSGRFPRELQSGALELAWIAEGKLDGYASSWTNPWDLSAGVLLVREAGGKATDIYGNDWVPSFWGVIAGSEPVHATMLAILLKHFEKEST